MNRGPLVDIDADIIFWSTRAFYIFAAYAIVIVRFIPDLRDRFLGYGARSDSNKSSPAVKNSIFPRWFRIQFDPVLDWLAEITVPHSWFAHFYICSTVCSAVWLYVYRQAFSRSISTFDLKGSTDWQHRAMLALLLMQIQGLRRLYECLIVAKPSKSRMWFGHYLIGIAFYLVTNVAVWLETASDLQVESRRDTRPTEVVWFNGARVIACIFTFFYNSLRQFQVHRYLASLTTYQVPNHPIFIDTNLICPHYGFEVNVYLTLAVLTARDMRVFNLTMLCAVLFVVVNLGVTADGTKKWLMNKFPKQRPEIAQRRRMLASIW